jgi:LacI family transcriptional regulator
MPKDTRSGTSPEHSVQSARRETTLQDLAEHLGLSKTTISVVLNRSPVAAGIPQSTQDRVLQAARDLSYKPNHLARSLRTQKSQTIGVLVPELEEPYAAAVLSGIEDHLIRTEYLPLVGAHRSRHDLQGEYLELFRGRKVDGLILLASSLEEEPAIPTVSVSGRGVAEVGARVVINHDLAAQLALTHLVEFGHRDIAFFKGQPNSADTEERWRGIVATTEALGIGIRDDLSFQLSTGPEGARSHTEAAYREGYEFGKTLAQGEREFTALFAFNDVSAIGAMRAFRELGLSVPGDVSVVGFDDILSAAFHNPGLTTVRQPLHEMGETAARLVLKRVANRTVGSELMTIEPTLVVRGSTGPAGRRG